MKKILSVIFIFLVNACTTNKPNLSPVTNFEVNRYMGTWYEIARLDNWFERGLENISANYSLREDGKVKVINKGYKPQNKEWKTAEGIAKFKDQPNIGSLKVSFFRPFYGDYNIIELDDNYSYVLIAGSSYKYLWILARDPKLDEAVITHLLSKAKTLGFETEKIIFVNHKNFE